jgi:hypothetical protein
MAMSWPTNLVLLTFRFEQPLKYGLPHQPSNNKARVFFVYCIYMCRFHIYSQSGPE